MPSVSWNSLKYALLVVWGCVLIVLSSLHGCRERVRIEPTPDMEAPREHQIRVLLFDNIKNCTIAAESDFRVVSGDVSAGFGPTEGPVAVQLSGGRIVIGRHAFGPDVEMRPESPFVATVNGREYRGQIRLVAEAEGFDVINVVPLEPYLAGVVGAEMPSYWQAEALQAQAVASRTYCLYHKQRYGRDRSYDVRRTEANQVYGGVAAETATVWSAVRATEGQVLTATLDGRASVFPTYFSSTCGGHTEDAEHIFPEDVEALRGVACPWCRETAPEAFYAWPAVEMPLETISQRLLGHYPALRPLEQIVDVTASRVSEYEGFVRIIEVNLIGKNGKTHRLEGENFRLTVDPSGRQIRSIACTIEKTGERLRFANGRGFGHGVGLCQYGALGMAREGASSEEILRFYYPTAKVTTVPVPTDRKAE